MGDRCDVTLWCAPSDVERLKQGFNDEFGEPYYVGAAGDGTFELTWDEVNYAGYDFIMGMNVKGIPFVGRHSSGGEYGEGMYACDGETVDTCYSSNGGPIVCVDTDAGLVRDKDLANVAVFCALWRKCVALTQREKV